ncbi:hypothetical protein OZK63_29705 [Streptomyces sp. UMAF16]|nr:hypothetical protein [Streptomyces sp. UMAF16]
MRTKDVRVGETYRCEVPLALPWRRYRPETMGDSWLPLSWLRGTYFQLSVVDVDTIARTAQGLVIGASPRVTVELTEDQAQEAGLPPEGGYQVSGTLLDAEGEPVELPRVGTLTVPLRWLHPVDTPVSPSHHAASVRGIR